MWIYNENTLPFNDGNNGGVNCELNDAKCGGKKSGGADFIVPLSRSGRKAAWL